MPGCDWTSERAVVPLSPPRPRPGPRRLPPWLVLALALIAPGAGAVPVTASLDAATAAYVYNLIKFTRWPEAITEGLAAWRVCIRTGPALARQLEELAGRTAQGRPLEIVRLAPGAPPGPCQVLVLQDLTAAELRALLRRARRLPLLTVTTDRETPTSGQVVRLYLEGRRIRFDIDLAAASRAGLGLSAKLLGLAQRVIRPEAGP